VAFLLLRCVQEEPLSQPVLPFFSGTDIKLAMLSAFWNGTLIFTLDSKHFNFTVFADNLLAIYIIWHSSVSYNKRRTHA
jgi:hypothetical protein